MTSSPGLRGWSRLQARRGVLQTTTDDDDRRRQTPAIVTSLAPYKAYTMCRRASNKKLHYEDWYRPRSLAVHSWILNIDCLLIYDLEIFLLTDYLTNLIATYGVFACYRKQVSKLLVSSDQCPAGILLQRRLWHGLYWFDFDGAWNKKIRRRRDWSVDDFNAMECDAVRRWNSTVPRSVQFKPSPHQQQCRSNWQLLLRHCCWCGLGFISYIRSVRHHLSKHMYLVRLGNWSIVLAIMNGYTTIDLFRPTGDGMYMSSVQQVEIVSNCNEILCSLWALQSCIARLLHLRRSTHIWQMTAGKIVADLTVIRSHHCLKLLEVLRLHYTVYSIHAGIVPTAKRRITQTTPYDSIGREKSRRNSNGVMPEGGAK